MTGRTSNIILGVLFFTVGVLSLANTLRFQHYAETALRRDSAQEQCMKSTLAVLRSRDELTVQSDNSEARFDGALAPVLDALAAGRPVDPEAARRLAKAFDDRKIARYTVARAAADNPIPNCNLGER